MSLNLIVDTCALIWLSQDAPLSPAAINEINRANQARVPVLVSMISAWELGLLVARGRVPLAMSVSVWFNTFLARSGFAAQGLSADILIDSSFLPGDIHRDPADRIIIATARALDLTIITRDRLILDYAASGHVRALAC